LIIILKPNATKEDRTRVLERIEALGLQAQLTTDAVRTLISIHGPDIPDLAALVSLPGVERVVALQKPYRLGSKETHPEDTRIMVRGVEISWRTFTIIAGPCTVENREQLFETARAVHDAGAHILRGGAFKTRTSPYSFQGLGLEGLLMLREAADELDMPLVTEVTDTRQVEIVERYADIIQVGARNMQTESLLKEVGKTRKPVLLKRSMSATARELLMAAEYILAQGNPNVVLCERGIKTFETSLRYTLDLGIVPYLKKETHLPVIVDPSHSSGRWDLVGALACGALAVGAAGVMLEVHPNPADALCDGPQSLVPNRFRALVGDLSRLAEAMNRRFASEPADEAKTVKSTFEGETG
jgi:3-deoxy-7-phosphoheptulonate synthase